MDRITPRHIYAVQKLLQQTNEAVEEFFRAPYGRSALNFLEGKACAYRRVLTILEEERIK